MKIISKFKNFFDYKMTKYGVNEKLVYTRKAYCEYSYSYDMYNRISEEEFNKKGFLRLDCTSSNEILNLYYEKEGFILKGKCIDGEYIGNKREKRI